MSGSAPALTLVLWATAESQISGVRRSGFHAPHTYRVQSLDLRPGDRLVMLTDGMLERHANSLDLSDLIVRTRALHPREAARTSSRRSSTPTTATCRVTRPSCAWTGTASGHSRRDADTGADLADASAPSRTARTTPGR
ncbi:hypothetical protein GCM10010381_40910 [Streptomyces xantholiticus]|nr:hypothetical protein GCM10010381_40910 [Streptomyces xantholiticus]